MVILYYINLKYITEEKIIGKKKIKINVPGRMKNRRAHFNAFECFK